MGDISARRAKDLADATVARIARIAPRASSSVINGPGLAAWSQAWERVADADVLASLALLALGESPDEQLARATDAARRACDSLCVAWQRATLAWIAAGQPTDSVPNSSQVPENTGKHLTLLPPILGGQVHDASVDNDLAPPVPDPAPDVAEYLVLDEETDWSPEFERDSLEGL